MSKKERICLLAFLALALALVFAVWQVFDRKTACRYTEKINGFFNEPAESMDVLCYGSSRMYCTLDPLVLHAETGLRSYVLATQQQPLAATYCYMKESLKTQSPKVLLLEATMAFSPGAGGEGALRDCLDPLPWSENKLAIIRTLVPEGERSSYYFNLLKYHQRWKELSAQDFRFDWRGKRDPLRGYHFMEIARPETCAQQSYADVEAVPLSEESLAVLRDMKALAEENGAQLMLLAAPYAWADEERGSLKGLHAFCEDEGIVLLDMNEVYDSLGFDAERDFVDEGHLNVYGSAKATRLIGETLLARYGLTPESHPADAEISAAYAMRIEPFVRELNVESEAA
ncbi:MAG: hypothetical protein K6F56_02810 [Oscillospiraceae bacterium]|nr:hypothetical protein [Oscillospiraceae bacterium]